MAKNPDPSLKLTSLKGVTRTLDDWSTMFHLTLVILPARPEASAWVPVARRIFRTFRDADCRTGYCVPGPPEVARRVLADAADEAIVFVDPDRTLIESLGLEHLPRSCTCARTRRSSPRPKDGTRATGSASRVRSARRWHGPCPRSRAPATRPPRRAGPPDPRLTDFGLNSANPL